MKRGILYGVTSVYDPLRFISPMYSQPNLFCKEKISRDEEIPQHLLHDCMRVATAQLNHFSVASERSYETVSYLKMKNEDGLDG